jgi:serine beta-lactamase-like protein LACTB, mitochondrial
MRPAPRCFTISSRYLCVVFLALTSFSAFAAIPALEAERMVREFVESSGPPGLSMSVGWCDHLVWSKGFGAADIEQNVHVDPATTKFRVGSIAKPMTAYALVSLAVQGRIDIDADVRRYVPAFPKKAHDFSVRQLAGHLAGIRHYAGSEAYSRVHYASVGDSLAIFANDPLVITPGEKWSYSSYGYNLLSAVIEQAADKPFLDVMAESVFTPLGMTATGPDRIDEIMPNRGRYYVRRGGRLYNEPEVDNSYKWASGGLLSTTDDLARFGLAHMNDRQVTPEMRTLLWTEQKTVAGTGTGYGIGWRIVVDAEGNRWVGHGGGSIGGTSQLWLFPEHHLVIATASNQSELDYGDLLSRLRKLFVERLADDTDSDGTRRTLPENSTAHTCRANNSASGNGAKHDTR